MLSLWHRCNLSSPTPPRPPPCPWGQVWGLSGTGNTQPTSGHAEVLSCRSQVTSPWGQAAAATSLRSSHGPGHAGEPGVGPEAPSAQHTGTFSPCTSASAVAGDLTSKPQGEARRLDWKKATSLTAQMGTVHQCSGTFSLLLCMHPCPMRCCGSPRGPWQVCDGSRAGCPQQKQGCFRGGSEPLVPEGHTQVDTNSFLPWFITQFPSFIACLMEHLVL